MLVNALRRALYLQAAVWAVAGIVFAAAPRFAMDTVLGQPPPAEPAWFRILGLQAFGLALLMVLVGHRAQDLWWWSWAFAFATVGTAVVAILHAAFGVRAGDSAAPWWGLAAVAVAFSVALLYGLYVTAREYEPG
ncbi:MAG: hypothetical protein ABR518_01975 [Actinomycetota bacterium]